MEKAAILDALKALDISVEADFIPWSKSRNFDPAKVKRTHEKNLNWHVRLIYKGRTLVESDYNAGLLHSPAYAKRMNKMAPGLSLDDAQAVEAEIEGGFAVRWFGSFSAQPDRKKPLLPDACDVVSSFLLDGGAIDHSSFEDWASDFGCDTDSRKAEAMYRACLDIGLKLRNGLGEDLLERLRNLFQDY